MFRERLKELRKRHRVSQQRLGELLGVSAVAVGKWERGVNEPDIGKLMIMADFFGVTLDELCGRPASAANSAVNSAANSTASSAANPAATPPQDANRHSYAALSRAHADPAGDARPGQPASPNGGDTWAASLDGARAGSRSGNPAKRGRRKPKADSLPSASDAAGAALTEGAERPEEEDWWTLWLRSQGLDKEADGKKDNDAAPAADSETIYYRAVIRHNDSPLPNDNPPARTKSSRAAKNPPARTNSPRTAKNPPARANSSRTAKNPPSAPSPAALADPWPMTAMARGYARLTDEQRLQLLEVGRVLFAQAFADDEEE